METIGLASFWSGKRVVVTGNTGFKGSWLYLWLRRLGAEVSGISLPPTSPLFDSLHSNDESTMYADIRDYSAVKQCFEQQRPEIVFHLAAQPLVLSSYESPLLTIETNVMGTANVMEAARRTKSVRAIVNVTTDKVYENKEKSEGYTESEELGGYDPYSASKSCSELITSTYRRSFFEAAGIFVATARSGNVIGGGDFAKDRILPDIVRSCLTGKPVSIRNPSSIRPWLFVLDSLYGYLRLAQALVEHGSVFAGPWNFGPLKAASVLELTNFALSYWKDANTTNLTMEHSPLHETSCLTLNWEKSHLQLTWSPLLSIREAVEWTLEWHRVFAAEHERSFEYSCKQIELYQNRVAECKRAAKMPWADSP